MRNRLTTYPGAQFIVRVQVTEVYNNCPRYIHKYQLVERSQYVPRGDHEPPIPEWKLRVEPQTSCQRMIQRARSSVVRQPKSPPPGDETAECQQGPYRVSPLRVSAPIRRYSETARAAGGSVTPVRACRRAWRLACVKSGAHVRGSVGSPPQPRWRRMVPAPGACETPCGRSCGRWRCEPGPARSALASVGPMPQRRRQRVAPPGPPSDGVFQ